MSQSVIFDFIVKTGERDVSCDSILEAKSIFETVDSFFDILGAFREFALHFEKL